MAARLRSTILGCLLHACCTTLCQWQLVFLCGRIQREVNVPLKLQHSLLNLSIQLMFCQNARPPFLSLCNLALPWLICNNKPVGASLELLMEFTPSGLNEGLCRLTGVTVPAQLEAMKPYLSAVGLLMPHAVLLPQVQRQICWSCWRFLLLLAPRQAIVLQRYQPLKH